MTRYWREPMRTISGEFSMVVETCASCDGTGRQRVDQIDHYTDMRGPTARKMVRVVKSGQKCCRCNGHGWRGVSGSVPEDQIGERPRRNDNEEGS